MLPQSESIPDVITELRIKSLADTLWLTLIL